jgi:predicted dehydrogenase
MVSSNAKAIRALVVGTGFGCQVHVPTLRAAGFEVAALVGTDSERLASRAAERDVPRTFIDLDRAIAETGASLVAIATPPNTHAPLALKAIGHGCHVVCEKPMALDAGEAQAMLDAAERAGVIHLVGHELRWLPDRALIGRAIADGVIGAPRFLSSVRYIPFVLQAGVSGKLPPSWWFDKEAGGGWLGSSGSHMIDQIRAWLGEFESLSAALPTISEREGVAEDALVVRFRMENGAEGVLQESAGAWGPRTAMLRIAGTRGTVWAENGVVHVADAGGARELPVPDDLLLPAASSVAKPSSAGGSRIELGPYLRLYQVLRAAIEGRAIGAAVSLPTFRDGLACIRVMDAIRLSAANGGAIVQVQRAGLRSDAVTPLEAGRSGAQSG